MKKNDASTTTTSSTTSGTGELAALSPAELGTVTGAGYRLATPTKRRRGPGPGRSQN